MLSHSELLQSLEEKEKELQKLQSEAQFALDLAKAHAASVNKNLTNIRMRIEKVNQENSLAISLVNGVFLKTPEAKEHQDTMDRLQTLLSHFKNKMGILNIHGEFNTVKQCINVTFPRNFRGLKKRIEGESAIHYLEVHSAAISVIKDPVLSYMGKIIATFPKEKLDSMIKGLENLMDLNQKQLNEYKNAVVHAKC